MCRDVGWSPEKLTSEHDNHMLLLHDVKRGCSTTGPPDIVLLWRHDTPIGYPQRLDGPRGPVLSGNGVAAGSRRAHRRAPGAVSSGAHYSVAPPLFKLDRMRGLA